MAKVKSVIQLLRVQQWLKNTFLFLPIFFGLRITQTDLLINTFYAFLGFSFIASAIYIFNDWLDIEADKLHPKKKDRPMACGKISKRTALLLLLILMVAGLSIFIIKIDNTLAYALIGFYIIQNFLYTVKLKNIAIVDVTIIALGFVIRILIGGAVSNTPLSQWIIIMTFLLALFLALAKRRDDVLIFMSSGNQTRKNIHGYNLEFLNASMVIMASIVIVSYIMYATSADVTRRLGDYIYLTTFFVIIGLIRYLQITFVKNKSGSPTKVLLSDMFLKLLIAGWITSFAVSLYINI